MSAYKPIKLATRPDGSTLTELTPEQLMHLGELALGGR
jgi:hypothetical protein